MGEPSRTSVVTASLGLRSLYPFVLHALSAVPREERANLVVADVPCGDGMLTFPLAAAGFNVRPLDLFPEYLDAKAPTVAGRSAR